MQEHPTLYFIGMVIYYVYLKTEHMIFINQNRINDEPFKSRAFLLFSIVAGFIGTFLAIVGTGMVCCNARCIPAVQVSYK